MKNYGENNSNRNNVLFAIGDRVRYYSEDNQIQDGVVSFIFYEIMDQDGILQRRDSSLVIPAQKSQRIQPGSKVRYQSRNNQTHEGTVEAVFYEISDEGGVFQRRNSLLVMPPENPQQVDPIPLFERVELLKGPYAGSQGILVDDSIFCLIALVEIDGEMKKVHVGRWEDMKVIVDRPSDTKQGRDRSGRGDGSGGREGATSDLGIGYKRTKMAY